MNWKKKQRQLAAQSRRMREGVSAMRAICMIGFVLAAVVSILCGDYELAMAIVPAAGAVTLADKIGDAKSQLSQLIDQRGEIYQEVDKLEAKEAELRKVATEQMTDEQKQSLKETVAAIGEKYKAARQLSQSIDRQRMDLEELVERQQQRQQHEADRIAAEAVSRTVPSETGIQTTGADQPIPGAGEGGGSARVEVLPPTNEQTDHDISDLIRCAAVTGTQPFLMQSYARESLRNERLANNLQQAMTAGNNGAILPDNMVRRMIELLRPRSVIRSSGPRLMPLINGNLRMPKALTGASASYSAEQANIGVSTPTTGQITLAAKKLTALVVQTGELIRRSDPSSDAMVRDDLLQAVATKEDVTFLRSDGSSNSPKGLLKFATDGSTVITANATVNAANVEADVSLLVLTVEAANSPMLNCRFFMTPRSFTFLQDLRDSNGNKIYPELSMATPMLKGYPVSKTTNIPNNLGDGTNESEVYFGDMSEFIIADASTFILEANPAAAYHDGSNVQAAFSRDEVPIRIIVEHDSAMRHAESIAVLDGVLWGA